MDPLYIILGGILMMALFAFIVSYIDDHPKRKKGSQK